RIDSARDSGRVSISRSIDPVIRVQPCQFFEERAFVDVAREVDAGAQREPHVLGVRVRGRGGETNALTVAECAQPDTGVDAKAERRVIDDADQWHASMV